ncbi:hypothetical protein L6452_24709 [Arctium lappa]|uniref:Uncharacterized protein n=1 Tax=Arctium lappa TaxID=4217 RepID=A0ACB9ABM4_ARCLA|nr:hypothetical protein L6452_24709 [Arctium lappa]
MVVARKTMMKKDGRLKILLVILPLAFESQPMVVVSFTTLLRRHQQIFNVVGIHNWREKLAKFRERKPYKMSGVGKKVVDVAFKASKTIDWDGMAKMIVSDEARKEFSSLRRAFDEVNSAFQTKFSQECQEFAIPKGESKPYVGGRIVVARKTMMKKDGRLKILLVILPPAFKSRPMVVVSFTTLLRRHHQIFNVVGIHIWEDKGKAERVWLCVRSSGSSSLVF